MGYILHGGGIEWWSVNKGALYNRKSDTRIDGYEGRIIGVRKEDGEYNGRPTTQLHIKMQDGADTIIIAGSLYNYAKSARKGDPPESATVWARMIITRLANPANNLKPSDVVQIGIYQFVPENSDAMNCASLRRGDETLDGPKIAADEIPRVEKALAMIIQRYGWNDAATPESDQPGGHDDPDLPF